MSTPPNVGPTRDRLSDHDMSVIGQAHQLVSVSGPAAVRAYLGSTAVSYAETAHACREALSQAMKIIGELLAVIERLAGAGTEVTGGTEGTVNSEWAEPMALGQLESGQAEVIGASSAIAPGDTMLVRSRIYEITFTGRAGDVIRAAFDDCAMTVGAGTTTLRAQLPDQAALWGLVQRIIGLGLEVVDLHLAAPE